MPYCHTAPPNKMTRDCRPQNQRPQSDSPNGGNRLLGKREEKFFINRSLPFSFEPGWGRFAVVDDLSLL
jgi:hypothetical protein